MEAGDRAGYAGTLAAAGSLTQPALQGGKSMFYRLGFGAVQRMGPKRTR